jgi:hypothetical protein
MRSGRTLVLARPADGALREALQRGGFIAVAADGPNPDRPNAEQAFWTQAASAS